MHSPADEWALLRLAPSMIASGTAAADPSGLFSSIKESLAGAMGMADAFKTNSGLELFGALAADRSIPGMPDAKALLGEGSREQQMQNFKSAVLDKARAAVDLVARKGSPAEADAYRGCSSAWPKEPRTRRRKAASLASVGWRSATRSRPSSAR